jgi:hypothetical protein
LGAGWLPLLRLMMMSANRAMKTQMRAAAAMVAAQGSCTAEPPTLPRYDQVFTNAFTIVTPY